MSLDKQLVTSKYVRVYVTPSGSTETELLGCSEITINESGSELDKTGFDTGGQRDVYPGPIEVTLSLRGHWDASDAKFYSADGIVKAPIDVGQPLDSIRIVIEEIPGEYPELERTFGDAIVTSANAEVSITGDVDYSIECRINGAVSEFAEPSL